MYNALSFVALKTKHFAEYDFYAPAFSMWIAHLSGHQPITMIPSICPFFVTKPSNYTPSFCCRMLWWLDGYIIKCTICPLDLSAMMQ